MRLHAKWFCVVAVEAAQGHLMGACGMQGAVEDLMSLFVIFMMFDNINIYTAIREQQTGTEMVVHVMEAVYQHVLPHTGSY